MGFLFSSLKGGNTHAVSSPNTCNTENIPDFYINFENPTPSPEEAQAYEAVSTMLRPTSSIIDSLRQYKGCAEEIRQAISNPNPETEQAAWRELTPAVAHLKEFYEFAATLEEAIPKLLQPLCQGNANQNIDKFHALAKVFADILDFVFAFDELKMANPAIQNDFSYYRRSLSRLKMANSAQASESIVQDELANRISLFYAYHTPMLKTVIDSVTEFVNKQSEGPNVADCLSTITLACLNVVTKQEYVSLVKTSKLNGFCQRVMVACTVLYDHIKPSGVYNKSSTINVRNVIKTVQTQGTDCKDTLICALRFNSKHLNDEDTPKQIKALLNE
ncbi:FAM49A-like protein [Basidiobolus meristosporus CBS 931.73]|uniref:FAM49A-like protein n=1 Tax=Basidiobolus meristosporus CBS 931.73 TaxID=1314790 RepID=A0A1Y1ZDJ2_9FUNG|nr:FAM49A-like protein [Basidiobolus meristosporus CBS 931.73]|eukprot:ORY08276.1 FAM49A-like protein [Basidiobolus meristosporus CBS 931.73]